MNKQAISDQLPDINQRDSADSGSDTKQRRYTRFLQTEDYHSPLLIALLILALALRLGYALAQDQRAPYTKGGGDTAWYLQNGYTLVTDRNPTGTVLLERLPTAPLYLILIGIAQAVFSQNAAAIIAIRVLQVLLSTATVYLAGRLAARITGRPRAGLLTAAVLAISPVLILESAQVLTETLYIFLLVAGLTVYVMGLTPYPFAVRDAFPAAQRVGPEGTGGIGVKRSLILAGIMFGLATLTRAVLLFFPFGLLIHLVLVHGWRGWRTGLKQAALLLTVYWIVVLTWTGYNLARWHRVVIGAEGMTSFIYVGSRGWSGPAQIDQQLSQDLSAGDENPETLKNASGYLDAAGNVIRHDPLGYARRRVSELAEAVLQPYGTVILGGKGLKDMAHHWINKDRSLHGLWKLTQGDNFWPKLALYLFHFGGLILGMVGAWRLRRAWPITLPLIGLILYTLLMHLVTLALPRYIFPLYPVLWVLAAGVWKAPIPNPSPADGGREQSFLSPSPPAGRN